MEVKLPKMQPSFLSLCYNSLFIFILLIDCSCVPRDQLYCITGTEAFHVVLLALVGRGPAVLPSDFPGLELPHSIQVWHWGSISCCYDPMPGALWSCRFSVLFIEPFCAKTTLEFNWKSQSSLCTVHIGVLSEKTKTRGNLALLPLLVLLSSDLQDALSSH